MSSKQSKRIIDSALIAAYVGAAISSFSLELNYVIAGSLVILASLILIFKYTGQASRSEARTLTYLSATVIVLGGLTGIALNSFSSIASVLYTAGLSLLALAYSLMVSRRRSA
ncbi:MAG: hypothetical protein ACPLSM_04295 [Thermosphaera sp.]